MGKLVADASFERRPDLVLDLVVIPLNAAIHLPLVRCLRERLLLAGAHHLLVCTLRECLTLLGLGEGVHRLGCHALLWCYLFDIEKRWLAVMHGYFAII
jgi:hypothetical protein